MAEGWPCFPTHQLCHRSWVYSVGGQCLYLLVNYGPQNAKWVCCSLRAQPGSCDHRFESCKRSQAHLPVQKGSLCIFSCSSGVCSAVPLPPAVPVLVTQLASATQSPQLSITTPTSRLLPSALLLSGISRALLLTHMPFGSSSRGEHHPGHASLLSPPELLALVGGKRGSGWWECWWSACVSASTAKSMPTPASTSLYLQHPKGGCRAESLSEDCRHFRDRGLIVQALLNCLQHSACCAPMSSIPPLAVALSVPQPRHMTWGGNLSSPPELVSQPGWRAAVISWLPGVLFSMFHAARAGLWSWGLWHLLRSEHICRCGEAVQGMSLVWINIQRDALCHLSHTNAALGSWWFLMEMCVH